MKPEEYKTFDDLEFKPHIPGKAIRATVPISNGWVISVIEWLGMYADIYRRYECACVWEEDGHMGCMCIPGMINDVFFCSDRNKVDYAMKKFQKMAENPPNL